MGRENYILDLSSFTLWFLEDIPKNLLNETVLAKLLERFETEM